MDKFVVPIGLPGLTVVRRKRLLPLCYNLRTFGIHCPGVADDNRYAVESIRSFEYPYVAVKLADYRRLENCSDIGNSAAAQVERTPRLLLPSKFDVIKGLSKTHTRGVPAYRSKHKRDVA
jgi:hypothetical protein